MTFSVRSGDSGLDSPEVHRPCGRSVGHSRGVDKGDELFMHPGGVLTPDRAYVASPVGTQAHPYVVPLFREPNQGLLSLSAHLHIDPSSRSSPLTAGLGRKLTPFLYLWPRLWDHYLSPARLVLTRPLPCHPPVPCLLVRYIP